MLLWPLLLLLKLLGLLRGAGAQSSWGYTYNVTAGMLSKAWETLAEPLGGLVCICAVGFV